MQDIDKIKEKVQKLLNQAADRAGTPEGESFYDKAFYLMAAYGFDERDLAAPDEGDEVAHKHYDFGGSYSDMQARLLMGIAHALHCDGFYRRVYRSTRVEGAEIFGLRRHVERVDLLYSMLMPVMMAQARDVEPTGWESAVVSRRSFMTGFAAKIAQRLREAEGSVAESGTAYALALIDDAGVANRARDAFADAQGLSVRSDESKRSLDPGAFFQGQDAGSITDLGQTKVRARPALPC